MNQSDADPQRVMKSALEYPANNNTLHYIQLTLLSTVVSNGTQVVSVRRSFLVLGPMTLHAHLQHE